MPAGPQLNDRPQLTALTGSRFLAALWVVGYHYVAFFTHPSITGDASWLTVAWRRFLDGGPLGVDFFFILSGFILAYSYTTPEGDLRGSRASFWVARLARIYPVYLIGLALDLVPFLMRDHRLPGIVASALSLPLLVQAWLPFVIDSKAWNPPGWSLSSEAFFYLAFPVVLLAVGRLDARKLGMVAIGSWVAFSIMPTPLILLGTASGQPLPWWLGYVIDYNPLMRFPEFVGGMAVGLIFLEQRARKREWRDRLSPTAHDVLVVALSGVAVAILVANPTLPSGYPQGALVAPLFAALIYVIAQGGGRMARLLSTSPSVWLGEISYGVYILHWPVWSWVTLFNTRILHNSTPVPFVVYLPVLLAASACSYQVIERPLRRAIRVRWERRQLAPRAPVTATGFLPAPLVSLANND